MDIKEIKANIERTIVKITSNVNSLTDTRDTLRKEINAIDSNIDSLNATLQHLMYLRDAANHVSQEVERTSKAPKTHLERLREQNIRDHIKESNIEDLKTDPTKIEITVGDLTEALAEVFSDLFE